MIKIKNTLRKAVIGLVAAISTFGLIEKANAYFTCTPTDTWRSFYSENSEVSLNDEVGVFVNSDNPNAGKICIGAYAVKDADTYGFLDAYGDDTFTTIKDGAKTGDELEFRIWDSMEYKEYFTKTSPNSIIYGTDEYLQVDLQKWKRASTDIYDLGDFSDNWLGNNCSSANNYCNCFDTNRDGNINLNDYAEFAEGWLR